MSAIEVEVPDSFPSDLGDDMVAIAGDLEDESVDNMDRTDTIQVVTSMAVTEDRGEWVARCKWGGTVDEYDDITGTVWSPSTIVYDTFESHGYNPPEGNPFFGVKMLRDMDEVIIEVPLGVSA